MNSKKFKLEVLIATKNMLERGYWYSCTTIDTAFFRLWPSSESSKLAHETCDELLKEWRLFACGETMGQPRWWNNTGKGPEEHAVHAERIACLQKFIDAVAASPEVTNNLKGQL